MAPLLNMDIDWDKIRDFLTYEIIPSGKNGGFHFDTWMLILAIIAILVTTFVLRGIKKVITRKMEDTDKLKVFSSFLII